MSETKQEVFEALLYEFSDRQYHCVWKRVWRERYEKAERFGRGHDVDDLYETELQENRKERK